VAELVKHLPEPVASQVERYVDRLGLAGEPLRITVDRREFERWLGRRVSGAIGGAYVYLRHARVHAILINLPRIDLRQPMALEIVVAEELVHMRDWIDGDHRRHAHHGHDRIAWRVAELTGTTMEQVRSPLLPVERRPYRYVYACPGCGARVRRRRRGTWSCGHCASAFDRRFQLRIVEELA
jgi:predicted SprT family Zn-dependent metalloprotease